MVILLQGVTVIMAETFLVYRSTTGGTWTNTSGIAAPIEVDLSTAKSGAAASLNEWFADELFLPGDEVWIISGTYVLTDSISLIEGVSIYGGFSGSESAITGRVKGANAWDFTNATIIDGNELFMGISGGSATNATIIDGLTITKCKNAASLLSGGGAWINGNEATIQNCIISNCVTEVTSATSSGGVVISGGATMTDCYIHDNQTAGYGGGVTVVGDACSMSGCKITNNSSLSFGGGVNLFSNTSGVTVENCEISNNTTADKSGGGLLLFSIAFENAEPITITGCTFESNSAPAASGNGGAMYVNTNGANTVNITNCTFTNNTANATKSTTNGGGAIWIGQGNCNIDKCTFTGNKVSNTSGGAITNASANGAKTISNSIFTANESGVHGSALMLTFSATVNNCLLYGNKGGNVSYVGTGAGVVGVYNNCTFASNLNAAGTASVGVYLSTPAVDAPNAIFTNCLFYNSGAKPANSDSEPPVVTFCGFDVDLSATWTGDGNIFTITKNSFVDADNNDYRLATGSTAINAGTTIVACNPDITGFTRDANYDMGAYEYDPSSSVKKVENAFNCYAFGNNVIVKDVALGKVINIYSVTGVRVLTQKVNASSMQITLPEGLYIVNVDSQNKKVFVK